MSYADRKWLEEAMKAHTFNDTDRLTELIAQLKEWAENASDAQSTKPRPSEGELVTLLDEMCDLAELHPRNNLNFCVMGGMTQILALLFSHESDKVRKGSCHLLTAVMTNNRQVQEFASKSGAVNLVGQFQREELLATKDAVFSSLAAWIKADNFEGKRKFIE